MKIIISPAKKMNVDTDTYPALSVPPFIERSRILLDWLRSFTFGQARSLWCCNEKIAQQNYERLSGIDLSDSRTPAILSYEGIQYQYMAPRVFDNRQWSYVQKHLRILSGFYGVLRPLDGVSPYRLEMQTKGAPQGFRDLYAFWGNALYHFLEQEENKETGREEPFLIINLASAEYSRSIAPYVRPQTRFLTCVFGQRIDGRIVQKGTLAKMARGEMVRFLAEKEITDPEGMKGFDRLGYRYEEQLSDENRFVYLKENKMLI